MNDNCKVKDQVLAELRHKKIKLWLAPYFLKNTGPNRASLDRLADSLKGHPKEQVMEALNDLQAHALEKLEKKSVSVAQDLELKILGLKRDMQTLQQDIPASWSKRAEIADSTIHLYGVCSDLTASNFLKDLLAVLNVDSVRLICKGKSISLEDNAQLSSMMSTVCGVSSVVKILCIVSYERRDDEDRALITSIRQAANKLGRNHFDVTDQHGNMVSMLPAERLAFLTAIGLHRLGSKRSTPESCLVFLLEADKEWDNVNPQWRDRVDNYGLLQLDIAWIHLKLESMDNLIDVTLRLDLAEAALLKQVHSNFVTLALVQAEMGNAVPPLSAVFCRLFLLQGVAYRFTKDPKKSAEKLDQAWALCQSLRKVSSIEKIDSLCDALGVPHCQAISALRRTNGNADQAATLMATETAERQLQTLRRAQQRELGLCNNSIDYVDLDLVPQVQTVLGFEDTVPERRDQYNSKTMSPCFVLAAELLRLTDNNLEEAIDVYQDVRRSESVIRERVAALDERLTAQGLHKDKKRARKEKKKVDEIAFATLISMGVQESMAERALRKSDNNTETALIWLTRQSESDETTDEEPIGSKAITSATKVATDSNDSHEENPREPHGEHHSYSSICSSSSAGASCGSKRAREGEQIKRDAELFLEEELKQALEENDLEEQYFGSQLDEERNFIERFRTRP